jgi:phosphoribosylformylglycinamidine cyclo-ligase
MPDADPYAQAGVDYDVLDALKRTALHAAEATSGALTAQHGRALDNSRGESAFVFEFGGQTLAIVQECLGTKSVLARELQELTGENRFADVASDTVSAIANDLIPVGALPLVINAYFSVGSASWYTRERVAALVEGWRKGCEAAGAAWGGGESPSLAGLVAARDIELAGSGIGAIPEGRRPLLGEDLRPGDEIVLIASNGIHTNGLTLALKAARGLPEGLAAKLPSGRGLGSALLDPSYIYAPLVRALFHADAPVSYMAHITGHGLRKLMRANRDLTYRISELPPVPEVLAFLTDRLRLDAGSAFGTFNMGTGFAVFVRPGAAAAVISAARACGFAALQGGVVEDGPRQVLLEPVALSFAGEDLQLR